MSTCDHIFDLLLKIDYIRILDHSTEPSLQGRMYCKLHDSFEHSIDNCNMFHQILQSDIDKGRLKFVEMQADDQSILIGLNGENILHRLSLADSCNDEKVHMEGDEIKSISKEIVHKHIEDILEGNISIEATSKASSTGGATRKLKDRCVQKKKTKAAISTRVRNQKLLSCSY